MFFHRSNHNHRRTSAVGILLLGVLLFSGTVFAQPQLRPASDDQFFSVLAAVGYTRTAFKQAAVFSGVEKSSSPQFRAQVDYRLHPNFSVSAGMNSLGSTAFRGVSLEDENAAQNGEISTLSAEASVVGHLPLTSMSVLYARVGGAYLNVRQTQTTAGSSSTLHSNGFSPLTGIGVEVDLQSYIGFRMGMDWYFNAGDPSRMGEGAIQAAYGGFVFRFR